MGTTFGSVIILSIFLGLILGPWSAIAQISLELDSRYSPPSSIPSDPTKLIYSAPALDHMLEPIKVRVLDGSGNLVTEPVTVIATTILTDNWNQVGNPGDSYTGAVCMHNKWSHRFGLCRYMYDDCIEHVCNTSDANYPLGKVEAISEDGVATFHRLLHTESSTNGQRRLRFYADVNGTDATVVTNPFDVDLAASHLEITSLPQGDVVVNEPMTFTVQTMTEDPSNPGTYIPLTTGRHSTLNVDVTISWEFKVFYMFVPASFNINELLSSQYILAGADVTKNGNQDLRVRKRCVAGAATFTDIRVIDEVLNMQLNFTQTLPYYPWERWPPIYNETIVTTPSLTINTLPDETFSPAVVFTTPFDVSLPTMSGLEINSDSLTAFYDSHDANFPLNSPLLVQAVDSNGWIITDGPDSELNITVDISPSTVCLSVDSSFQLSRGQGKFPGSVCEPAENVQLMFMTVSSDGTPFSTTWTPAFNVTGDLVVAGVFSSVTQVNYNLLSAGAMDIISDGVWAQDFVDQGRNFVIQDFFVEYSNAETALDTYDMIRTQNADPGSPTIRAVIGPLGDDDTITLSTASKKDQLPIVGYQSQSSVLADKSAHPYVNRVSYSEEAQYFANGAYLASNHWNKVIVIKDGNHPIPAQMYQGFEANGVQIVLELTVPALSSYDDFADAKPLDDFVEKIINAGTKVIYSFVFAPSDLYLYYEAIRLEFAALYGYQWMLDYRPFLGFPYSNELGDCATMTPTCTTAFNGSISISPGAEADLEAPYWSNHLFDAYTNLDPVSRPATTLWMWPSLLGSLTLAHDSALSIFLGSVNIIRRNETITGAKLSEEIRTLSFIGGSGHVSFDENGNRPGFSGAIYNHNGLYDNPPLVNDYIFLVGYWQIDPVTEQAIELSYSTRLLAGNVRIPATTAYAPINYTNTRRVQGYRDGSDVLQTFEMQVPAAYYCSEGCGGGLAPDNNGTIYYWNYGECTGQDNCVCKNKPDSDEPGYAGSSCQQILCDPQCRNGECTSPDVCICEAFWTGNDCGTALCTYSGCNALHGTCTGPNICTCETGYWGSDCSTPCSCMNGICNDGQGGTGTCSVCNAGWVGADCDLSLPCVVPPVVIGSILLIAGIVGGTIFYIRRMKYRAALANNDWMVDYNDVIIITDEKGGASSMAFRSMVSVQADKGRQKSVVRNQGKWNSIEVAIKMIDRDMIPVNTALRMEIKQMRDIRHNNLCHFVGAGCTSPNICILMETAPKGSLDDILSSEDLKLDWNFKYSLLKDICRGMTYLSGTNIKSHGRLKSSNCVVDNRWTLKITDYGMHMYKSNQHGVPKFTPDQDRAAEEAEEGIENSIKSALFYTAPEIMRTGVTHPDHVGAGTIQGDMYSLAVIMVEVLTHEAPYQDLLDFLEVDDILAAITGRKKITAQLPQHYTQAWPKSGSSILRPTIPSDCDPDYRKLVESIWVEDPYERPSFQQVLKKLNSLSPQQGDLMDNLVSMLEKYSTNLEAIVAERTAELAAEKQKTEDLVCRMLPKAIAEQLKTGQRVDAETFECVTIYFSDIVGFTKIAGDSTPLQVVDLLNDLYTCFDAIIDHFDVYKVETIGDAYMVVSGLPLRNGDKHAGEIASMSLHLLSAILSFRMRHLPERKLQLRIGCHSGPVVAGVVGLKMPRYCLFGDTVNTASRMESGGLALRVHLSETTANILQKLGGYELESRGEREVKGKGVMTTYWLNNKEGFNRPLPTADMAASLSQHEFK